MNDIHLGKSAKKILLVIVLIIFVGSDTSDIVKAYTNFETEEYPPATYVKEIYSKLAFLKEENALTNQRVWVIDATREATDLNGGVEIAYSYYALPERVVVSYYSVDETTKDNFSMTHDTFEEFIIDQRVDTIIVLSDSKILNERIQNIMGISYQRECINIIDVKYDKEKQVINYKLLNAISYKN